MRVAVRADASPALGGGHIMRCLVLALALREHGAEVVFLSRRETREAVPALTQAALPVLTVGSDDPADAIAALTSHWGAKCDVLIVDSYALGLETEQQLRRIADRIVVLDDLTNRHHDCDLLLDQTYGRAPQDYAPLVPKHCRVLAGSRYALLRPEFSRLRTSALARRASCGPVERILISMGLTDLGGITAQAVRAVLDANLGAAIDVVLGLQAPSYEPLRAAAQHHRELRLHVTTPAISQLMVEADLAVGAAGSTMWERCCLGLPTIALVIADNQRFAAQQLHDAGSCLALDARAQPPTGLTAAIRQLAQDQQQRREMSSRASEVCDGLGVYRVLEELLRLGCPARIGAAAGRGLFCGCALPDALYAWPSSRSGA